MDVLRRLAATIPVERLDVAVASPERPAEAALLRHAAFVYDLSVVLAKEEAVTCVK